RSTSQGCAACGWRTSPATRACRSAPLADRYPTAWGFWGIDVRSAGKHRNGFPDWPKTGLNLAFWTFRYAKQPGAWVWALVQWTGGRLPGVLWFVIGLPASMPFGGVKSPPAALRPLTNRSALSHPTYEFSFMVPPLFLIHVS